MEIKTATGDIMKAKAGAILVSHYEGEKEPEGDALDADKALKNSISELIKQGDVKGKPGEITILHTLGKLTAGRVVIVGMGKKSELTANKLRGRIAEALRFLRGKNVTSIATGIIGDGINKIITEDAAQAIAEGALLGLYTFRQHITKKEDEPKEVKNLTIYSEDTIAMEKAITRAKILAEATNWARDLVNEPSNFMTPTDLALAARSMAKQYGLKAEVIDKGKMAELGMGGLLGVSQGSNQPPKFIIVSYSGSDAKDVDIALVGKGITFDSGGISIKPSENMGDMKGDMAGGAAVLGAIRAIAQLKPKINVTAIIPATENLPSGTAMKPGDIIKIMNGKTIEVVNTDAEGRLILADALSYAVKLGAKAIIDVATLTGSCQVALGNFCTGAFTNNEPLQEKVLKAGKEVDETAWPLPMMDEYKELIKSDVADIKNSSGRYGGAITAAKFLEEFVDKTPWVHMDIAGTSDTDKDKGCQVKGATGQPVRTLVNFVMKEATK